MKNKHPSADLLDGQIISATSYRSKGRGVNRTDDRFRVTIDISYNGFHWLKGMLTQDSILLEEYLSNPKE